VAEAREEHGAYDGRLEGIVVREVNVDEEDAARVGRVLGPYDRAHPLADVVALGTRRHALWRVHDDLL